MIYAVQDKNGSKRPKEASAPLPDMSKFAARGSKHCSAFLFQLTTGKTAEPNWPPKASQMCSKRILNVDIKYNQFSAKAPQKLTEAKHPCSSNCEVSAEVRHSLQLKSHMFQMMRRWCLHHTTSCTWSTQSKTKTVQRGPKKLLRPCLTCLSLQPAARSIAVHFCFSSQLVKTAEPNWPPKASQMCSKRILNLT